MTTEKSLYIGSIIAIKDAGRIAQALRALFGKTEIAVLVFHQMATSEDEAIILIKEQYYSDDAFKNISSRYSAFIDKITITKLSTDRINELLNSEIGK